MNLQKHTQKKKLLKIKTYFNELLQFLISILQFIYIAQNALSGSQSHVEFDESLIVQADYFIVSHLREKRRVLVQAQVPQPLT